MPLAERLKKTTALAATALLLAAALVLACFTLPVRAASEEVEEVLALLATLQGANIDPDWQPDITQNEAMVTSLLTAYGSLSDQQRAELTSSQNADLRAYFEALYAAQGRSPSAVDSLFTQAASPSSSRVTSAAPSRSTAASSRAASSQAASSAASTAYSQVTSAASSQNTPAAVSAISGSDLSSSAEASSAVSEDTTGSQASFLPQIPTTTGFFSFMGSAAFGWVLFLCLGVLVLFSFLRFLFAVRSAGPAPGTKAAQRALQKAHSEEDDATGPQEALPAQDMLQEEPLTRAERRAERRALRQQERAEKREEKKALKAARQHFDEPLSLEDPFETTPPPPATEEEEKKKPWTNPKPIDTSDMDAIARLFSGSPSPSSGEDTPPAENNPGASPGDTDTSGDKPDPSSENASSKKGARTGRPGRMRFSQGDAHDIDAIDD